MTRWWVLAGAALMAVVSLLPAAWLHVTTAQLRFAPPDVPDRPVVIVPGAGITAEGRPTRLLEHRLDTAARLYHRRRAEVVLVTGDNSRRTYNEPDAMRAHLADAGVPHTKIVSDYAGFSTWESCVRAREVFGVREAMVVTQRFHLPRAVALCRTAGIDTVGVAGASTDGTRITEIGYGYLREIPAAVKAAVEIAVEPEPTFLGDEKETLGTAMRAPRG